jgi:cell division protein FtsI (penicillin-binding protein 3)/stage V sporulation protein D (sporulation-specific penicillin-binding protein)
MTTPAQTRALTVILLFACGFTVISARLIQLQLVRHEMYREEALKMHTDVVPIAPRRGSVLDAHGRILAQTVMVTDLRIDGRVASERPEEVVAVAAVLGWPESQLQAYIQPGNRYQLLVNDLPDAVEENLRKLRPKSLIFQERSLRIYPNAHEGSHVIGFSNEVETKNEAWKLPIKVEVGMDGMERVMDAYLRGTPGERRIVRDARRKEIAGYRQSDLRPRNGLNVVLTLDQGVQHIIETEADRIVKEYNPAAVHIIVMRPATGEILGLTNRPTYDPNNRASMSPANLRNAAVQDVYEPGSTFKTITLAAALGERIAELATPVFCDNGSYFYAGYELKDVHPYGSLSLKDAYAKSSNIAFAKIGLALGDEKLYRAMRQFGFGQLTQMEGQALHGEQRGMLRPPNYWSKISLTRLPIGYELSTTNLQMTTAIAAIANEGKLMEPRFVKAVADDQGRLVKQFLPRVVRQAVSRETAAQVVEAMKEVVATGTGKEARLPKPLDAFTVAGKTGTSRKFVAGGYESGSYYASFIGMVPAEKPEFVVSILVDDPDGKKFYGGSVAAPAFRNVANGVIQALNLSPPIPEAVMATRRSG